jgi:hypothetical protein
LLTPANWAIASIDIREKPSRARRRLAAVNIFKRQFSLRGLPAERVAGSKTTIEFIRASSLKRKSIINETYRFEIGGERFVVRLF